MLRVSLVTNDVCRKSYGDIIQPSNVCAQVIYFLILLYSLKIKIDRDLFNHRKKHQGLTNNCGSKDVKLFYEKCQIFVVLYEATILNFS